MTDVKPTILVVEDEAPMRKFVRIALDAEGYRVVEAETGREALEQAAARTPDLILLDLGLPDIDGVEVTRRLREWSTAPIIVLTARGHEAEKVKTLDAGADDYLTKPFGTAELMARVRVALRHRARSPNDPLASVITVGALSIDLAKQLVFVADVEVHLTPIEYKLVAVMMNHVDAVLTHKQLLDQVWGPGHGHQIHYLRVFMTQLRRKLEANPARPRYLLNVPGVGYRIKGDT